MESSITPFSSQELIPQEEKLEIESRKGDLFIGIPKESQVLENRVCLTPDAVNALVSNGHKILMEAGAGKLASFEDNEYSEAGAIITQDTAKVFSCPIILKVEPPSLKELALIKPQTVLFSALQLKTLDREYFQTIEKKKITALAFEFIKDEDGSYPAIRSLSEIAGTASILIASEIMSNVNDGSGLMMGNITGVPPIEVVILGAGTVGEFAARAAFGLGANIKVFDSSINKLRTIQNNIGRPMHTSTIQHKHLLKALKRCDVVIGAVRGKDRSPILVTESMTNNMKKGAVVIDVSIDMGGCFETSEITSHEKPTYTHNGVIHYCVPNIPSRYAKTSSVSISNIFSPYLLDIGEVGGLEHAIRNDKGLKNGIYSYHGVLTNKAVAEWFDLSYRDINLLVF